jgi:ClpP class serine protease
MWLLEPTVKRALERAHEGVVTPSVESQQRFEASLGDSHGGASRILSIDDTNAKLAIEGVITKKPDIYAAIFGGGNITYSEINRALAEAESDPSVETITLEIDSPGGQFDGLFDTLAAIESVEKPTTAVISNVGASAAYAIASQADRIVASNRAARIGSVGVVATFGVEADSVSITSSDAPKKRPDVTTPEGVSVVREELDAMHEIFVDAIAGGRGITVEKVNADFGQGATLLAGEALKRGMIDAVADHSLKASENTMTTAANSGGNQPEIKLMDTKELKTKHPDVYAAAVQDGIDQERDRVNAHLTMGESSGDTKTAFAAIRDGSGMTATLQAQYMTAGMNRSDVSARQDDDVDASAGDNVNASDAPESGQDVASLVEARLGMEY